MAEESKPSLTRTAGSKGSLHSLLSTQTTTTTSPRPPQKISSSSSVGRGTTTTETAADRDSSSSPYRMLRQSHEEVTWGDTTVVAPSRLSQSYAEPRSTLSSTRRLEARHSEQRGELEWLDRRTQTWRPIWCVLKDAVVRCSCPWSQGDDDSDDDAEVAEVAAAESYFGNHSRRDSPPAFALEELAVAPGERGRHAVTLSLTHVTLVATDPTRGRDAFRILVEQGEYSFRAKDRDAMVEWLFGFHRSLSLVVSRLRSLKQQHRPSFGGGPGSFNNNAMPWHHQSLGGGDGPPQSASWEQQPLVGDNDLLVVSTSVPAGALHKKTSCRRRFGSPSSSSGSPSSSPYNDVASSWSPPPQFEAPVPPLWEEAPSSSSSSLLSSKQQQADEGVALYRKSSARPHSHAAASSGAAQAQKKGPPSPPPLPRIGDDVVKIDDVVAPEPPVVAKYVPPHLRKKLHEPSVPPMTEPPSSKTQRAAAHGKRDDSFEETGDDDVHAAPAAVVVTPAPALETVVEDGDAWRYHHSDDVDVDVDLSLEDGAVQDAAFGGGRMARPETRRRRRLFRWRSGARCERGQRQRNEDACVEVPALHVSKDDATEADVAFYAVYDGHSGLDAVQRCQAELHARVRDKLSKKTPATDALAEAFAEVDAAYCSDAEEGRASLDAGATALACVLRVVKARGEGFDDESSSSGNDARPKLVVANCGDCAAVLSRRDSPLAVPLSKAHAAVPGSSEASRVLAAGGWITTETDLCVGRLHSMDLDDPEISENAHERVRLNEIHRVCGEVAVTRAIGDVDFKGWGLDDAPRLHRPPPCFVYPDDHPRTFVADLLVPTPDVVERTLDHLDDFLVLATDGLWDVVDAQEAVDVARALFHRRNATPREVAQQLVQRALRLGSGDNVTVVVVQFDTTDADATTEEEESRESASRELSSPSRQLLQDDTTTRIETQRGHPRRRSGDDDDFGGPRLPSPLISASPPLLPTAAPSLNGDDLSEMPFELSVQ